METIEKGRDTASDHRPQALIIILGLLAVIAFAFYLTATGTTSQPGMTVPAGDTLRSQIVNSTPEHCDWLNTIRTDQDVPTGLRIEANTMASVNGCAAK